MGTLADQPECAPVTYATTSLSVAISAFLYERDHHGKAKDGDNANDKNFPTGVDIEKVGGEYEQAPPDDDAGNRDNQPTSPFHSFTPLLT